MATELKTDSWHRYMLYRSDERYMTFKLDDERRKAADAGKKFTASAYADVWAKDAGLVQRVRQFLGENFHWHDRLAKSGSDLDVVQTLHDMVHGCSIVVIPEEPRCSGGSVGVSAPARKKTFHEQVMEKMGLSAEAAWDYIDWYNATVQRLDESEAARKALSASVASVPDTTDVSTLLGDAQPFEYTPDAVRGDVEKLAASTNNPNYAAKMLGYDRDTFGDMTHAMKFENKLRGDDNVIWHDNGDVHFNGKLIDNMHNY